MASRKKKVEETQPEVQVQIPEELPPVQKQVRKSKKLPKFQVGDIVYISKNAEADLEGFTLFPQYKKDTYTVEAYNDDTGVYTLRRLKLLVKLQEEFILAPDEKAYDEINRKQF